MQSNNLGSEIKGGKKNLLFVYSIKRKHFNLDFRKNTIGNFLDMVYVFQKKVFGIFGPNLLL